MKKIIFAVILICIIFWLNKSVPNPIIRHFINEFMYDSTGWKLELYGGTGMGSRDAWFLTSGTDTAYFKHGISFNEEGYLVITQDSLQSKLNINPEGDILTLYDTSFSYYMDSLYFFERLDDLIFGPNGFISAPKTGQSIRLSPYSSDEYILDNSPTIGNPNDTTDIEGSIEGFIKDSLNNGIPGVAIMDRWIYFAITDSGGHYSNNYLSKHLCLSFEKNGFYAPDTVLQVWPDSTVILNITMSRVVGVTEIKPAVLNNFELTQNFPNPFNNSTSFYYYLPEDEEVEIIIYDQKGELVQKLFRGFQSKGQYRINWNANEMASGIYLYELKTSSRKIVKKCLLLK